MPTRISKKNITRARALRAQPNDAEDLLWWRLRMLNRKGFHFRQQVPFRGYTLDFAEHGAKLAIEVDGSQHGEAAQIAHDIERDGVLTREGYCVLRFTTVEVFGELDRVVENIVRIASERRTPTRKSSRSARNFVDLPTRGR